MSVLVYQAINAVAAELAESGIAKTHRNEKGDYAYRSIDDVLAFLAPRLARHKLCVLPRILEREAVRSGTGSLVLVHAAFDLVSALDGSTHVVESFGEALDESDKGTAKAISSAFKSAMLQAFCIPAGEEDADAASPRLNGRRSPAPTSLPEPAEGWASWTAEVIAIVKSCDTVEAIDRLRASRRQLLRSLQHGQPELYAAVGKAIASRLGEVEGPPETTTEAAQPPHKAAARQRKPRRDTADAKRQPAQAA